MYANVTGKMATAVNVGNAKALDVDKFAATVAHMVGFAATTGAFFAANSNNTPLC